MRTPKGYLRARAVVAGWRWEPADGMKNEEVRRKQVRTGSIVSTGQLRFYSNGCTVHTVTFSIRLRCVPRPINGQCHDETSVDDAGGEAEDVVSLTESLSVADQVVRLHWISTRC